MTAGDRVDWNQFAELIAQAADVPTESIRRDARLLDDLGLDSLALSEVIVVLLIDLGMASLEDDLAKREWSDITAGQLFDEYTAGKAPVRGEQYVIRTRRPQ